MVNDGRRLGVLAALGIDVYRLRANDASVAGAIAKAAPAAAPAGSFRLVIACAGGVRRDGRIARRLDRAVSALGIGDADVAWIEGGADGTVPALPEAVAYLMCGAAVARGCSASLPLDRQNTVTMAVSAEPAEWMRDGSTRRSLWQTLKPLARRLRNP